MKICRSMYEKSPLHSTLLSIAPLMACSIGKPRLPPPQSLELDLSRNRITGDGAAALAELAEAPGLQALSQGVHLHPVHPCLVPSLCGSAFFSQGVQTVQHGCDFFF